MTKPAKVVRLQVEARIGTGGARIRPQHDVHESECYDGLNGRGRDCDGNEDYAWQSRLELLVAEFRNKLYRKR